MSRARPIIPGATCVISRRCSERRYRLRPSKAVNELVRYVVAYAARKHGILLHAVCVMSNHIHIALTDPRGRLPAFCQDAFSLIARALNPSAGHWENFWAPGSYSRVLLVTPEAIVDKIAYTLTNPIAAGLVRHAREWPGVWSRPEAIGAEAELAPRPGGFFNEKGRMPLSVPLSFVVPAGFESPAAFHAQLAEALAAHEARAVNRVTEEGRGFLGARRVLAQKPTARPTSWEPRRTISPRVACRDVERRKEALAQLGAFLAAYREALAAWRRGLRETLFPSGTWLMRVQHGVRCAAAT